MPRGDRQNWGGARATTRPDAKPRGRSARGLRVELGEGGMAELRTLAAAGGVEPDALAARWLTERIAAEWAAYERDRGLRPAEPTPAEWDGEVL